MDIEETALKLIKENKEGIFQNELWKMLEIDSRKCSRLINKLMKAELIYRENAVNNGASTYLIKLVAPEEESYEFLLAGNMFSPCAGCRLACQPEQCELLTAWIQELILADSQEEEAEA